MTDPVDRSDHMEPMARDRVRAEPTASTWAIAPGLADLVQPASPAQFLEGWGHTARHFAGSLAGQTEEILDLASFEQLLATLPRAGDGWLHMVRETARPVPADMFDADGMLRLAQVRAAFRGGETLYLTKAHRISRPLMHLCRAVEVDLAAAGIRLRAPVSAHVFLTPPESRGFKPHRDGHGSLILQLHGSKDWEVYDDVSGLQGPRRTGPVTTHALPGEPQTFTLTAGDVLYIPEWWVHAARASAQGSLHATLRLFPLRWVDVLAKVVPEVAALEEPVPSDCHHDPDLAKGLLRVLERTDVQAAVDAAARAFGRRTSIPDTALPDDGLGSVLAAKSLKPMSWLVRSAGVVCAVTRRDDMVELGFPGGSLSGPAALEPVFWHLTSAVRLRPADLPDADGDYDRVELARQLVRAGILTVERTGSAAGHAGQEPA
jgi:hypothetical protein